MHVLGPRALVDEMSAGNEHGEVRWTHTSADRYLAAIRVGLAYRVLETGAGDRIAGLPVPYGGRGKRWVKARFYDGDVVAHGLRRDLERHDVNLLHVPSQGVPYPALVARYPYVINPHDFQHEHLPEFFSSKEIERRRKEWYPVQRNASAIVVHSLQTRGDALRFLNVPEEKVFYAPYGPLDTFPDVSDALVEETRKRLALPDRFVFYPARMWPHKNHAALLQAMGLLEKRGIAVNAVFTGDTTEHEQATRQRVEALGLGSRVRIVGRVSAEDMAALYRLCTMVVVPSLFEQNSGPMLEGIHFEKPLAVSGLAELVATLGDGGLVFDGRSPAEIASAIDHVWSSEENRLELIERVRKRKAAMSWEPFADTYERAYGYALEGGSSGGGKALKPAQRVA